MTAPIASGWSESPGGPCTHWKAPPFHGARRNRPLTDLRGIDVTGRLAVIRRAVTVPVDNNMVAAADRGMIRPGGRSRRGPQMSPTRDSTLHDPKAIITDLQRQLADVLRTLDQRTAERDEAQRRLAERTVEIDEAL